MKTINLVKYLTNLIKERFIFFLVSFFILCSSLNIFLFHFILDINLAKIGMLVMLLVMIPYILVYIQSFHLSSS